MADRAAQAGRERGGTVVLFSLAAFLAVLALLGSQLGRPAAHAERRPVIVRRIYATTVEERVIGRRGGRGAGSSSETSSSTVAAPLPPPASRTS